jgi:death-on-curing protein
MKLLNTEAVFLIHEAVINPNELQGLAGDKSLDAVVSRVENRIHYGMIQDEYDLASSYAVVIARGHVFNDGNKRTAFKAVRICLQLNNIFVSFDTESIGQIIIKVAQGLIDEVELARYLRNLKK